MVLLRTIHLRRNCLENYIGIDIHSKTSTYVVMSKHGEITHEGKIDTTEKNLIGFLRSIPSPKSLTFEETNVSQWAYCLLKDEVDKLIVCNPCYLPKKPGAKTDYLDALHLVMQLRAGNLYSVYHEDSVLMDLRTVVKYYDDVTERLANLKKQFKALLRSEAIECGSAYMTSRDGRKYLDLKNPVKQMIAKRIFDEACELEKKKANLRYELETNKLNLPFVEKLKTVPGVGPARAHAIAAFISTGHRFENKHKLWSYAMLIKHRDMSDGALIRVRAAKGRTELKNAFIGAALNIIISPQSSALKEYYQYLIEIKKLDTRRARKALARKVAAICLNIMKTEKGYDDALVLSTIKK